MFKYQAYSILAWGDVMGTTLVFLGNRFGLSENPWMKTPFGKKPMKIFQKTGRRAKLMKHPAVVQRWERFRAVRPEATRACADKTGMEKAVCIASYMSANLRK